MLTLSRPGGERGGEGGRDEGILPAATLNMNNIFNIWANGLTLYVGKIWCLRLLPICDRPFLKKIENHFLKWRKINYFFSVTFMFLTHIHVLLYWLRLRFVQFRRFPEVLWKSRNPRWRFQDGRHFTIRMLLQRHLKSSFLVPDLKLKETFLGLLSILQVSLS